jgi:NADH pyrophosphatase NudC (nudix superfamily)
MDIGSIFLVFALLILVAWFISQPLFERRPPSGANSALSRAEHDLSTLLAERDRIIQLLQELDFDNKLGKIPEEDYPDQRNILLQRGAEILRQLDDRQTKIPAGPLSEHQEMAIAARRIQQSGAAVVAAVSPRKNGNGLSAPDDELERQIAARRRNRKEKTGGFCPKCGKPIQMSDKFCPKCGAKVSALQD